MEKYRKSTHETYDLKHHIVWITKYRKLALTGKVGERSRELISLLATNFRRLQPQTNLPALAGSS